MGRGAAPAAADPEPNLPDSVPAPYSASSALGLTKLRMIRGVMARMISFLSWVRFSLEKSRPNMGRSPSPGNLLVASLSSSRIRPARICVSPSRMVSVVVVLRVPTS
jgi:hypothetical protein